MKLKNVVEFKMEEVHHGIYAYVADSDKDLSGHYVRAEVAQGLLDALLAAKIDVADVLSARCMVHTGSVGLDAIERYRKLVQESTDRMDKIKSAIAAATEEA